MKKELLKELSEKFNVIPLSGKIPISSNWWNWYGEDKKSYDYLKTFKSNFGILLGIDGLQVIDIDNHTGDAMKILAFIKMNLNLKNTLITHTKNGGYHIYYRSNSNKNNQILFRIDGLILIENMGENRQVVFYEQTYGSIDSIIELTQEQRDELFTICSQSSIVI